MNERLPSVCLVMFCVVGLFVMYQAVVGTEGSPPEIPPWNKSHGRMKDCVSPPQLPRELAQLAPPTVQLLTHRDTPPLLFPSQNLRLDPVPTGSILAKNPSPPKPSCH